MLNRKHLDYLDWKKIVELKNNGSHNTIEGLELMKKIISNMNSTRNPDTKRVNFINLYKCYVVYMVYMF